MLEDERRKRSRVETHRHAEFICTNGDIIPLTTENISLKGLLALPENQIVTGGNGIVRMILTPELSIEAECHVIRSDAKGIAIEFKLMSPESFLHLRNLVRYNAPDADTIDFELQTSMSKTHN
jgi:hypothetical protein